MTHDVLTASSRLAELASQLTPAQAQTIDHLLHSVKQLSASHQPAPLAGLPTPIHPASRNKPLMPKSTVPPMLTAMPLVYYYPPQPRPVSLSPCLPVMLSASLSPPQHMPAHKVVAPVSVPPSAAPLAPSASLLPQSVHSTAQYTLSVTVSLPVPSPGCLDWLPPGLQSSPLTYSHAPQPSGPTSPGSHATARTHSASSCEASPTHTACTATLSAETVAAVL